MTIDTKELRRLAQAVSGWSNCNQAWLDQSEDVPAAAVGHIDEDGNTYPIATIDCDQYYAAHQSLPLAKFYAAANPAVISELLDRLEAAEEAWKISDQTVYDLTEKVIPNIQEKLEEAEKERDDVAQQLVQSEISKREISEAHNAVTGRLSVLADENTTLQAKIVEMEQQEPVAWMLNCQTLGGDTGWFLSWTQSGVGMCNRLSGEENERKLYALPRAKGE